MKIKMHIYIHLVEKILDTSSMKLINLIDSGMKSSMEQNLCHLSFSFSTQISQTFNCSPKLKANNLEKI